MMTETIDELLDRGARALADGDADIAVRILRRAVAIDPDDADVRHLLGSAYETLGDVDAMKRELLQVRLLDAEADRRIGLGSPRDLRFIENVAAEVMAALPEPFRTKLAHVPVVLERRPSLALVRSGVDPRALGLFDGPSIIDDEVPSPARVVVFTHNLLAAFEDRATLAEQVEVTILHEVGHYFGLEEDDMERLDLA
jgi:predicted Zn-dependent protease with MMP-like domain